eukprot:1246649-Pleurochrysis_carterae.AAC.1
MYVRGGYVGQAHDVVSVAYRRRSAVGSCGGREEPRDRKGRTGRRRQHGGVVTPGASVQQTFVHCIAQEVVGVASTLAWVIVDGIGGGVEAGEKSGYSVATTVDGAREQEQGALGVWS